MVDKGKKQKAAPEMPFQVDRDLGVNIATQVTDGIRETILTGFYKPGDVLPKVMEFTRGLRVSPRPLLPVCRTLKREGLISPRRSIGFAWGDSQMQVNERHPIPNQSVRFCAFGTY